MLQLHSIARLFNLSGSGSLENSSRKQILIALEDPSSQVSEQYKSLLNKLLSQSYGELDQESQANRNNLTSLAILSSQPGEGKSTTAANLAVTAAQSFGKRVLVVDGDLRRPSIHQFFTVDKGPGLAHALEGEIEIRDTVQSTEVKNVFVITAGKPLQSPTGQLNSDLMADFHRKFEKNYDLVIYDTPPVLSAADALAIGSLTSGVIFLVQSEKTPRKMVLDALASLRDTPASPDACIMTSLGKSIDYYSYVTNSRYREYYKKEYSY